MTVLCFRPLTMLRIGYDRSNSMQILMSSRSSFQPKVIWRKSNKYHRSKVRLWQISMVSCSSIQVQRLAKTLMKHSLQLQRKSKLSRLIHSHLTATKATHLETQERKALRRRLAQNYHDSQQPQKRRSPAAEQYHHQCLTLLE